MFLSAACMGTSVPFRSSASMRLARGGKERKKEEKPASKEPLVMIRPLTLTPWLDGELVAPSRWSPLIHAS